MPNRIISRRRVSENDIYLSRSFFNHAVVAITQWSKSRSGLYNPQWTLQPTILQWRNGGSINRGKEFPAERPPEAEAEAFLAGSDRDAKRRVRFQVVR